MTRKLRTVGLTLIAAFAISAIGASAAQATQFHTKGGVYPATVTGVHLTNQVFKFHVETGKNNELICKKASFSGTLGKASGALTIHPIYEECTFSGINATVNTEKCNYIFNSGAKINPDEYAGTLDIECEPNQFINVVTTTCEIHITPQNGLKEIVLIDSTAAGNILTEFNLTAFAYSITKDGVNCPLTGVENRVDGSTTKGTGAKFSATVGGIATPITVE
jgi:hypothetical protein